MRARGCGWDRKVFGELGGAALLASLAFTALAWLPVVTEALWRLNLAVWFEVPALALAVVLGPLRYRWAAALVLLLSPIHARFWQGVARYAHGDAHYYVSKHCYRQVDGNLNDHRRVPLVCWGPTYSQIEWTLWGAPQNAAVDILVAVLGPMPGAYDGPLPSSEDFGRAIFASDLSITLAEFQQTPISVRDRLVSVRADIGPRMTQVALKATPGNPCPSEMAVRIAMWRDRVLMVALPWDTSCGKDETRKDLISFGAAVDADSGKVLGYYELEATLGNNAAMLAGVWNQRTYGQANK